MSTHSTRDRLRALRRAATWYLSCGDGVVRAPPFPTFLHLPGFWDEALVPYHPRLVTLDGTARATRVGEAIEIPL